MKQTGIRLRADPFGLPLTLTEALMVGLKAGGYSMAEISQIFHRSRYTIKTHWRMIYQKLGARNQPNAIAIYYGLLGPDPRRVKVMDVGCVYCSNQLAGHVCYSCLAELRQEIEALRVSNQAQLSTIEVLRTRFFELGERLASIESKSQARRKLDSEKQKRVSQLVFAEVDLATQKSRESVKPGG